MRFLALAVAAAAVAPALPAFADVVNGTFSAGNTGFSSDYSYRVVSDPPHVSQYGVTTSSFAWTQFWGNLPGDHTTGTGQFLIADIGPDLTDNIWSQTVAVAPGVDYTISAWLAKWSDFAGAGINVYINDALVSTWGPATTATWTQHSGAWNSGASASATISLRAMSFFQPGDDIAIDDISFVPAPGAAALMALGAVVAGRRRR